MEDVWWAYGGLILNCRGCLVGSGKFHFIPWMPIDSTDESGTPPDSNPTVEKLQKLQPLQETYSRHHRQLHKLKTLYLTLCRQVHVIPFIFRSVCWFQFNSGKTPDFLDTLRSKLWKLHTLQNLKYSIWHDVDKSMLFNSYSALSIASNPIAEQLRTLWTL